MITFSSILEIGVYFLEMSSPSGCSVVVIKPLKNYMRRNSSTKQT